MSEPRLSCRAPGGYCGRCDLLVGLDGRHVIALERDGGGLTVTVECASAPPPTVCRTRRHWSKTDSTVSCSGPSRLTSKGINTRPGTCFARSASGELKIRAETRGKPPVVSSNINQTGVSPSRARSAMTPMRQCVSASGRLKPTQRPKSNPCRPRCIGRTRRSGSSNLVCLRVTWSTTRRSSPWCFVQLGPKSSFPSLVAGSGSRTPVGASTLRASASVLDDNPSRAPRPAGISEVGSPPSTSASAGKMRAHGTGPSHTRAAVVPAQ